MMNVLVLLLVVGASLAVGMASLDNNIATNAQNLGVGEKTIDSQIDASLVLVVDRTGPDFQTNYKDLIISCKFVLANGEIVVDGSTIYCKLLDINGNLIAEGQITVGPGDLSGPITVEIPITWFAFTNSNNIENVDEIVFVVQGPPQG